MGVFAGGVLGYASGIFTHLGTQPWSVGAAIAGYLAARALGRAWLPPMAGGVLAGLLAAAAAGQVHPEAVSWSPPQVEAVGPAFNPASLLALSLPLVLITLAMGGVQGMGMLESQGYQPPTRVLTLVLGINSAINAAFGGHTSTIQNNGIAMLAGPDAGPREHRYVACLIASSWALVLGLCASTAGSLPGVLPAGLVASLAGLAILSALMDALRKVVVTDLPMSAFFALAIAASPLTLLGIGSAFWALAGGLGVSLLVERRALLAVAKTARN
jgi:benzoate membrane transport protein